MSERSDLSETDPIALDLERFRSQGRWVIDWIADYLAGVEKRPVLSTVVPGEILASLAAEAPEAPEPLEAILADIDGLILPGITHWNHPGFMAYFANSATPPGILAEAIVAALNVNGMLWRTSPAATELEQLCLDWLRQMLGLPEGLQGVITDTASMSSLLALAAAREAAGLGIRESGMAGRGDLPALVVYASSQAHSSIDKACITLGLGQRNLRKIEVDDEYRMRLESLAAAIAADRAAGRRPLAVVATLGTTSTTSVDPIPAIAEICQAQGLWLHVDGAYGGAAGMLPEMRGLLAGVASADSFVVNPHKWLMTPMDCSAFYVREPAILKRAFSLVPDYLRTREGDAAAVEDYMDWGVQLGRRFRALKLWFVLRAYGREGLAAMIREHCALATGFAAAIDAEADWERLAPTPLSVVCFRHRPAGMADEDALSRHNANILERVNATGEVFLSHTVLDGRYSIRLAIGNRATQAADVDRAWALLREAASASLGSDAASETPFAP
jgi:aromatic-L-amino-acid decarboxylase